MRKILVVTQVNPFEPVGGTSVLLMNLLGNLKWCDWRVGYLGRFKIFNSNQIFKKTKRLIPNYSIFQFLGYLNPTIKMRYAIWSTTRYARRYNPDLLIGVYPTIASIEVSLEVSKLTGIPLIVYLHDTLAEGLSHTVFRTRSKRIQNDLFNHALKVITVSKGMTNFYQSKYNLKAHTLEHSYPEKINKTIKENLTKEAFWGGEIYAINKQSFIRLASSLSTFDFRINISSLSGNTDNIGVDIRKTFYPERSAYISALKSYDFLMLALDWPDESEVSVAELSTIFPTKTIEYLASGTPIILHCPEGYYLSRFFKENNCGTVINSRNPIEMITSIKEVLNSGDHIRTRQINALKIAEEFKISKIQEKFEKIVLSGI